MTHLVIGYPSPLALSVAQRLACAGQSVAVIGAPSCIINSSIRLIQGDAARIDFGLSGADYVQLTRDVRQLTVAETSEHLHESAENLRDLESTRLLRVANEVVEFAQAASRLERLVYLSSLAVFGDARGAIFEKDFEIGQTFSRRIDEVLAVSEKQIHRLSSDIPRAIVRVPNIAGHEGSGEILSGAELGRLAKFAVAAPDVCEFSFADLPLHFETIERATEALVRVQPGAPGIAVHMIDDEPWTDRQVIKWMFDRIHKSIIDVPRGSASVGQLFRAATIQSGRVRTTRAEFQRGEAVRQLGSLLARNIERTLERLFGATVLKEEF